MDDVEIVRNPGASRFELLLNGERIGKLDYTLSGALLTITHTGVSEDYSGQGLAARLVAAALSDVQAQGESVLPECPYARGYIVKHPEWAHLVPADRRDEFGLAAV